MVGDGVCGTYLSAMSFCILTMSFISILLFPVASAATFSSSVRLTFW